MPITAKDRKPKIQKTGAGDSVNIKYEIALENFKRLVQQAVDAKATGTRDQLVFVRHGSKYDALMLAEGARGVTRGVSRALYFVNKEHGIIFARRTNIAPNFTRFYGYLSRAEMMDWGFDPAPRVKAGMEDDAGLEVVGGYAGAVHYRPRSKSLQAVVAKLDPAATGG